VKNPSRGPSRRLSEAQSAKKEEPPSTEQLKQTPVSSMNEERGLRLLLSAPIGKPLFHRAIHLSHKIACMFTSVDIDHARARLSCVRTEHGIHFRYLGIHNRGVRTAIALAHDQVLNRMRRGRALLVRHAKNQHAEGHGVRGQPQQLANLFSVLHNVAI